MARKPDIHEVRGPQADFDEQLWPVNAMLGLLAVIEAGVIIATSNFDEPRLFYNGWFHLGVLAVIVLLLAAGVFLLQRRVQRRMQLAILASLLVHMLLCLGMTTVYLQMLALEELEHVQGLEDSPPTTLPVYHMERPDQQLPSQAVEKAVETLPNEAQPPDLKKELTKPKPKPKEESEPTKVETPKPKPIELQRTEDNTPKPSEALAKPKLARSETDPKTPSDAVNVPQAAPPKPKAAAKTDARVNPLQRQDNLTNVQRQATAERPDSSPLSQQAAQLERRQSQLPDQHSPIANQLQRQAARVNIIAPAPVATQPTPIQTATPNSPVAEPKLAQPQRQSNAPPAAQPSSQPAANAAPSVAVQTRVEVAAKPSAGRSPGSSEPTMTPSTRSGATARTAIGSKDLTAVISEPVGVVSTTPGTPSNAATSLAVSAPVTTIARGTGGGTQPQFTAPTGNEPTIVTGEGTIAVGTPLGQARRTGGEMSAPIATSSGGSTANRTPGRTVLGTGDASTETVQVTAPTAASSSASGPATSGPGNIGGVGDAQPSMSGPTRQASDLPGTLGSAPSPEASDNGVGSGTPDAGPLTVADAGPRRSGDAPGPTTTSSLGATGLEATGLVRQTTTEGGTATEKVAEPTVTVTDRGDAGSPAPGAAEMRLDAPTGTGLSRQQLSGVPVRIDSEQGQRDSRADNGLPDIEVQIPQAFLDRHGNVTGSDKDLIGDGQMKGQSILIATFSDDTEVKQSPLLAALIAKGFVVEQVMHPLPPLASFEEMLDKSQQLWLWSSPESNRLPKSHLKAIVERWRSGKLALCLLADNAPHFSEATAVLDVLAPGSTIRGDYKGTGTLHARSDDGPGFDPKSPLFFNITNLYEGITVSHLSGRSLTPVCYATDGRPLVATLQQKGTSRLVVHCGFTSFYQRFWDDAGVRRFALNTAGWLGGVDSKSK